MSNEKLTFQKAVAVALETKDAAKGAKERVYGLKASETSAPVHTLSQHKKASSRQKQNRKPAGGRVCDVARGNTIIANDCESETPSAISVRRHDTFKRNVKKEMASRRQVTRTHDCTA